jgi:hypothetical protein
MESSIGPQPKLLPRPATAPDIHLTKSQLEWRENTFPFAGRIGGNQEFTLDKSDPDHGRILKEIPDAAPFCTWKASFDLSQFKQLNLWKAAFIEGWGEHFILTIYSFILHILNLIQGTLMIVYLTVIIAVGLGPVIKYAFPSHQLHDSNALQSTLNRSTRSSSDRWYYQCPHTTIIHFRCWTCLWRSPQPNHYHCHLLLPTFHFPSSNSLCHFPVWRSSIRRSITPSQPGVSRCRSLIAAKHQS